MIWPVEQGNITSGFGFRESPAQGASTYHPGVDIAVPVGTAVMTTIKGVVSAAGFNNAKGNYIEVTDGNIKTVYGHLSDILAKIGQSVEAGQKIALSGNTGISTGPHLDYRVYENGKAIDPLTFGGGNAENSGFFSLDGITNKFTDAVTNNWGLIIGGLLVLGLISGRNSR